MYVCMHSMCVYMHLSMYACTELVYVYVQSCTNYSTQTLYTGTVVVLLMKCRYYVTYKDLNQPSDLVTRNHFSVLEIHIYHCHIICLLKNSITLTANIPRGYTSCIFAVARTRSVPWPGRCRCCRRPWR